MKDIILGQDFLTWLWYKSEQSGGRFATDQGEAFDLTMEQRVSVEGGEGETKERATVSGPMSELREARLGLAMGKKVTKALIRVEHDSEVWQMAVKAEDLTLSGLKTPHVEAGREEDDDPDAAFLEKIYLVEKCLHYFDAVFAQFLALRLTNEWPGEVDEVRRWLAASE